MGTIFISAAHGGFEGAFRDPGAITGGTTEAAELIATRDLTVSELRARGLPVAVPTDDLSLIGTIDWINARAGNRDVAVEIQMNAYNDPTARGISAFYYRNNSNRQRQANMLISYILRRLPELPNRGAKPDTDSGLRRRAFCLDVVPPSIIIELGFLTNPQDRFLLQSRRRDYALGLADGLQAWSAEISGVASPLPPKPAAVVEVAVSVYGRVFANAGIIASEKAYIHIDLVKRISPTAAQSTSIQRVTYKANTYLQAVGLRNFNVLVGWDAPSRTVVLS